MAIKKITSSDKPYMSEYDKTVEARLQSLESQAHTPCSGNVDEDRLSALEAKVDDLIQRIQRKMSI